MPAARSLRLPAVGVHLREIVRRAGLTGFWRWWAHELAAIVPPGARVAWQRRRTRPTLIFDDSSAVLYQPVVADGAVRLTEAARVNLAGEPEAVLAEGRAAIDRLSTTNGGQASGSPRVVVAVSSRDVLRKRLSLPAAVEDNLRQTVAYDLDRHTPFKSEELYFDAVVVERDTARNLLRVDFAAIRRAVADPLLARAEAWGAHVVALVPGTLDAVGTTRLNLLAPERRPVAAPWKRWQFWLPIGLVTLFALVAIVLPLWQKRDFAIALNATALEARQKALISDGLRSELDRQVGDFNFALDRKYAFPGATLVLEDVSRVLPDDTWITAFEMRTVGARGKDMQRELALRGESGNAGRLVSLLEESTYLTQAAPRSPTTKIQPGPGEIFDIGAKLKVIPAPAAQPLVLADASSPPAPPAKPPVATPPPAPATPAAPAAAQPAAPAAASPAAPAAAPSAPAPTPATAAPSSPAPVPPPAAVPPKSVPASAAPAGSALPAAAPPPKLPAARIAVPVMQTAPEPADNNL